MAPALMDDLLIDVFLRLPPDDSACLVRASLVCKAWRRLLSHRAFLRRYRDFHGAPPFLGFFYNFSVGVGSLGSLFLHTMQPSPFPPAVMPAGSLTYSRTLDCRHGRVLLLHRAHPPSFTVSDPITGKQRCISAFVRLSSWEVIFTPDVQFTAAVLCASRGCDHVDCGGGRSFHVVLVGKTRHSRAVTTARAWHYSSETRGWTVSAAIDLHSTFSIETVPSLLTGDAVLFSLAFGRGIFKYALTSGVLSVINLPPHHAPNMMVCTAEDGGLGVAAVDGCRLRLFSGRADPDGVWIWAQSRVMELDSMIPTGFGDTLTNKFYVVGYAEGTGYIFIRVNDSIFSVDQKSGRMSKIGTGQFGPIFPFMRFGHSCSADLASARMPGANED